MAHGTWRALEGSKFVSRYTKRPEKSRTRPAPQTVNDYFDQRVQWGSGVAWGERRKIAKPCEGFFDHYSEKLPEGIRPAAKLIYEGFSALFGRDDVLS